MINSIIQNMTLTDPVTDHLITLMSDAIEDELSTIVDAKMREFHLEGDEVEIEIYNHLLEGVVKAWMRDK